LGKLATIETLEPRALLSAGPSGLYAAGTLALGVSADGSTVVGEDRGVAYRWTAVGGVQPLGPLEGVDSTIGTAVSADGSVVVGYDQNGAGFRWTAAGGYQPLGRLLPGTYAFNRPTATNADGTVVVGSAQTGSSAYEAYRWTDAGGLQRLGDLHPGFNDRATGVSADGSVIVGFRSLDPGGVQSFRWTAQDGMEWLADLPIAYAVSGDGTTLVGVGPSSDGDGAVSWTHAGGTVNLGDLLGGDDWSEAYAVNADGSVIVGSSDSAAGQQAFVWDTAHGMRSVAEVLANDYGVSTAGMALRTAYAVSGDGTVIAGQGFKNGNSVGWVAVLDRPLVGPAPAVTGRHVFYNHSAYDGGDASADARDLAAIAPDKTALLPGQLWSFSNVTSYSRGINGVLVDFAGIPPQTLTAGDFAFRFRGASPTDSFRPAPPPASVTLLASPTGANVARYAMTWPDGAMKNGWLEVTVKANANTGIKSDDVFYFGNLVAETGDALSPHAVTSRDVLATRAAVGSTSDLTGRFDFDRNGRVTATDLLIARGAVGHALAGPFDRSAAAEAAPVPPALAPAARRSRLTSVLP
jgi:probable HAF family extracellular repeat protein